jgi:tetratricopeptide (TPR) repeat protein
MRSPFTIGTVAALLAILLFGNASISAAQPGDDATTLNKKVIELYNAGRYAEAIPIAQRLLAIDEKALGRDHPDVAQSLNNLSLLYVRQGRYADTEPLLQRALAIEEKALGRDHPDVATTLNNLASVYESQGRYADAEPLHKRALAIREKALGREGAAATHPGHAGEPAKPR